MRLGVERNVEDSLRSTKKKLGNSMWFWAESSKGMRKPGSLKERGKIGTEQKGVLHVQGNNLKKNICQTT